MRRLRKYELLEGVENVKSSKIVAYNTVKYIKWNNPKIYIRFYDTDIIVFHSDYIMLNSGRNMTKITKNRINKFQNVCYIRQIGSQWLVSTPIIKIINFYDGIKFNIEGHHIPA